MISKKNAARLIVSSLFLLAPFANAKMSLQKERAAAKASAARTSFGTVVPLAAQPVVEWNSFTYLDADRALGQDGKTTSKGIEGVNPDAPILPSERGIDRSLEGSEGTAH